MKVETDIIMEAGNELVAQLSKIKALSILDSPRYENLLSDKRAHTDIELEVAFKGKVSTRLIVEVKSLGHPQYIRNAIHQLKHDLSLHQSRNNAYGVVAVPFISNESAQLCIESGLGYLDLSGNCHLEFNSIYIHIEGKSNKFKSDRSLQTLFSPKATRALRCLLNDINREWKVKDLQSESDVSLGLVSNIRKLLRQQEWSKEENPLRVSNPGKVLEAWSNKDQWKKRTEVREYSLLLTEPNEVTSMVHELLGNKAHAFTQWTAARLRHPYAGTPITTVYVEEFPDEGLLKEKLFARRVDHGGILRIVLPKDLGVFNPIQTIQGFPLVSDVQIYLDLINAGYRGDEAAAELRTWDDFSGGWK